MLLNFVHPSDICTISIICLYDNIMLCTNLDAMTLLVILSSPHWVIAIFHYFTIIFLTKVILILIADKYSILTLKMFCNRKYNGWIFCCSSVLHDTRFLCVIGVGIEVLDKECGS